MVRCHYAWVCTCIGLGVALLAAGCNRGGTPGVAAVAGQVTLDGQPLKQGSIRFLPIEGAAGSIASGKIVDGRYQLSGDRGAAIGWNRVEINALRKTGKMIPKPFPSQGTIEEEVEAIPPQYNSASTLKFEVKPGSNTADFELKSK